MRVLIVEDDMSIALMIEDMLLACGHEVAGIAMRLPDAIEQATSSDCDVAILDVNLDGLMSFPVAEKLRARGIPFIFATGYGSAGVPPPYAGLPTLAKPFTQKDLEMTLLSGAAAVGSKSG